MATKTLTQKLKENVSYLIKSRCNGKYDFKTTHIFTKSDPSLTINMTNYDGLSYTYDSNFQILDFTNTILPWAFDYNNVLENKEFALINYNTSKTITYTEYGLNGTIIGNPTISDDYVITATNAGHGTSYFRTSTLDYSVPFRIEMPISFSNYVGTWPYKSVANCSLDTYFGNSMIMAVGQSSFYHDLTVTPSLPFNGKLILEWDGYTYKYTAEDKNGTTYGPITWNSSVPIPNSPMNIGYGNGVFDLKEFKFISSDSSKSYNAVDVVTITKPNIPGCFYNYTDNGSAVTLNCFTRNKDKKIILTPDNSYSDERFLGTVTVPAHTVEVGKTLTINPTPNDAVVTIISNGERHQTNVYTTYDNTLSYEVTKVGYASKSGNVTINDDMSINVSLDISNSYLDVENFDYTSDSSDNVVLTNYKGNDVNIVVPTIQRS